MKNNDSVYIRKLEFVNYEVTMIWLCDKNPCFFFKFNVTEAKSHKQQ